MKTLTRKAYKFEKLSKAAQQKAIEDHADINVNYDWWDYIYEDAEAIGLKINGFDDYTIDTELTESVYEVCKAIMENHGDTCDTHQLAMEYLPQFVAARLKGWEPEKSLNCIEEYLFGDMGENEQYEYYEEWEREFKCKLEKLYLKMLQDEYEYRCSDEEIAETLKANDYDFTREGEMI